MSTPERRLRAVQRASAIYDLIAVTPFAIPGVAAWQISRLHAIATQLGSPGDFPAFQPTHLLFANLFGIFTIVWSVLRLRNPEPTYALCDAILRFAFATTLLVYVVAYHVTCVLLLFVGFELLWGGLQFVAYAGRRGIPRPFPASATSR